jgi:hypothetical protein
MIRTLSVGAAIAAAFVVPPAHAASQQFRIDATQSFVAGYEGVWHQVDSPFVVLSPGTTAWQVRWEQREVAIGGTFDLEIFDSPVGAAVKRLEITNPQVTGVPAGSAFTAPTLLSWYAATGLVEWSQHPGYNDGFFGADFICACFTSGPVRSDAGTFDGASLNVQGGLGMSSGFFSFTQFVDGAGPPTDPIDQSAALGAFSYRLVASPAPEPETLALLGLGLPLLAVAARRRTKG